MLCTNVKFGYKGTKDLYPCPTSCRWSGLFWPVVIRKG